ENQECTMGIFDGDDEVLTDDIVSSEDEREESNNTDRLNDNSDLFSKPYFDAQEGNTMYMSIRRIHEDDTAYLAI
nr:hypothetical protein [Tanacetum cinerariifolium]